MTGLLFKLDRSLRSAVYAKFLASGRGGTGEIVTIACYSNQAITQDECIETRLSGTRKLKCQWLEMAIIVCREIHRQQVSQLTKDRLQSSPRNSYEGWSIPGSEPPRLTG